MKQIFFISIFILISFKLLAQSIIGTVTNKNSGEPVPFANVFFANTTNGTATDAEGNFTITSKQPGRKTLVVSMIGYKSYSKEVDLKQAKVFN